MERGANWNVQADNFEQAFQMMPVQSGPAEYKWRFTAYGKPNPVFEPLFFIFGGWRSSRCIWHELVLTVAVDGAGVSFSINIPECSAFPSHRLWIITASEPLGRRVLTQEQGQFAELWNAAPPPARLNPRFVRGVTR